MKRKKKYIRIGGLRYEVRYQKPTRKNGLLKDNCTIFGNMNAFDRVININVNYLDRNTDVTLLHEIIHAVLLECSPNGYFAKEGYVKNLTHILYNAIKDSGIKFK